MTDVTPIQPPPVDSLSEDDRQTAFKVLDSEYKMLMAALAAVWSMVLTRTTIFLGVVSAAGVALGFAAQGAAEAGSFRALALLVLPLLLFLGLTTFIRLVQLQRESAICLIGMHRIRHFYQQIAPATRPYFVLSPHDDPYGVYRGIGTGVARRAPRYRQVYLLAQTQGVVGIVTGAVAAALVALALSHVDVTLAWIGGALSFVVTVAALFTYWQGSIGELLNSVRSINPTPPSEVGAPF
jgi:hypothetical protein